MIFIFILSKYLTIFQIIKSGEKNLLLFYIGMICVLVGLCYGVYVFVFTLFKFKHTVAFDKDQLIVRDILTNRKTEIPFCFIDNLMIENYVYRTVFSGLIITTKLGKKYSVLNLFIWNFKDVRREVRDLKSRKVGLKIINKTNTLASDWI
jgi:hypothetical protein